VTLPFDGNLKLSDYKMVTSNVLQRVIRLKKGMSIGTSVAIDIDGRQYIVTARHVLPNIQAVDQIEVFFQGQWNVVPIRLVGVGTGEVDIVVLALEFQIAPAFPLPCSEAEIVYGQEVYFLGFPYGLAAEVGELNRHFPLPFIKKGCLSTIVTEPTGERILYLDGNNNPGFSGGPVVFTPPGRLADFRLASIISGYRFDPQPVLLNDQPTQLISRHNTGIIISFGVNHAVDLINANPIGFSL
jgi:hypothetical protein